jgi:hypothetical protein
VRANLLRPLGGARVRLYLDLGDGRALICSVTATSKRATKIFAVVFAGSACKPVFRPSRTSSGRSARRRTAAAICSAFSDSSRAATTVLNEVSGFTVYPKHDRVARRH